MNPSMGLAGAILSARHPYNGTPELKWSEVDNHEIITSSFEE